MTMKHLIRQCHIREPKYHVMCILGAKYPLSQEEFSKIGLPGTFDPKKAGKRMKLETAETWESSLSKKGNRAETWHTLIDHNKLPFMAMLRNLRNLVKTGVDQKYHEWAFKQLTNPESILNLEFLKSHFLF